MTSERESIDIKKAMAYDLLKLLQKDEDKQYSVKELQGLIDAYITGLEQ